MSANNNERMQRLAEVGFSGVFSGLIPQAQVIFSFIESQGYQAPADLGRAFCAFAEGDYQGAARILENSDVNEEEWPEKTAILALCLKASGFSSRAEDLCRALRDKSQEGRGDLADFADQIAQM